jgi:CO/xanthine dehydrogenase FAD-binding subunit
VDLNTVTRVVSAADAGRWRAGDAWLAGGTYLYSEPQPHVSRLLDLVALGWEPWRVSAEGLEIAATCTIAQLLRFARDDEPSGWPLCASLIPQCCHAFLASFKIWNTATVGGNLCNALPAGPMISLTAALDGVCTAQAPDGGWRRLPVTEFVTGPGTTALAPGEVLRSIFLPAAALRGRTAFRQASLNTHGRSAALLIGRTDPDTGALVLTITASTAHPVQLRFDRMPDASTVRQAIERAVPADAYFDDIHGLPAWRRHLTLLFAEQIRAELAELAAGTVGQDDRGSGA